MFMQWYDDYMPDLLCPESAFCSSTPTFNVRAPYEDHDFGAEFSLSSCFKFHRGMQVV